VKVVAVVSAKGGVGKTSSTANLAAALAQAGVRVLAVDLDPQNALGLHFGLSPSERRGSVHAAVNQRSLSAAVMTTASGARVLPYGTVEEEDREAFERYLDEYPHWLADSLSSLKLGKNEVVLVDTPPGPSAYLRQALGNSEMAVVVMLPDAASYASLGLMAKLIASYARHNEKFRGQVYLVNQHDGARVLARDVLEMIKDKHGQELLGAIHQDESVGEALACDQSVLEYDPHCLVSQDYADCAERLCRVMGIR
jgi:cellulose synthase operon protein YhjQ